MAGAATVYSCKCLNIQLRSSVPLPPASAPANSESDSEWTHVLVGQDQDIRIIFPHLTLRSRHRGPYIDDPTRCARYTTLTCLSCQTLVYRIHQIVLVDDEVNIREGPIVTKGWAETQVLRRLDGWVQVSNKDGVLVGERAINSYKNLPQYSELFGILLPASASPKPTPAPSSPTPKYTLPPTPPIFPDTKSNNTFFSVLATIASRYSSSIRSQAEDTIDGIVKQKVDHIKSEEEQIKWAVTLLLGKYTEGIRNAQAQSQSQSQSQSQPNEMPSPSPSTGPASAVFTGAPSSVIKDFVPMRITQSQSPRAWNSPSPPPPPLPRTSIDTVSSSHSSNSSSSLPRVSALSASLVNSSFHHPRARGDSVTSLASSATLTAPQESNHVFQFRRTVDDEVNTAVSFRYFQIEEEMKKRKEEREVSVSARVNGSGQDPEKTKAKGKEPNVQPQEQDLSPKSKGKGKRKVTFDVQVTMPPHPEEDTDTFIDHDANAGDIFEYEDEYDSERIPFKNKYSSSSLMYDSETYSADPNATESNSALDSSARPQPMKRVSSGTSHHTRNNSRGNRDHFRSGSLPASYLALRPASLPAPRYVPLVLPTSSTTVSGGGSANAEDANPTETESQSQSQTPLSQSQSPVSIPTPTIPGSTSPVSTPTPSSPSSPAPIVLPHSHSQSQTQTRDRITHERNTNILSVLGASLPSHRAAWKGRDEKGVYESFVHGGRDDEELDLGEDEDEVGEGDRGGSRDRDEEAARLHLAGIPSSVPISIQHPNNISGSGNRWNRKQKVPPLSLASYQPQSEARPPESHSYQRGRSDIGTTTTRQRRFSSEVMRRKVYAERDVERGIDPGPLDYVVEDPEDEGEGYGYEQGEEEGEVRDDNDRRREGRGEHAYEENGPTDGNGDAEIVTGTPRGVNGTGNSGSRGRDRAHSILESQARSGVPDDEMWRSLV